MKKVWKFLGSMRFALILLVILAAACAGGSFIPQGLSYEQYAELWSPRTAGLILALRLDDVFHAWWFLLLTAFLCGNLLLCNLTRLPQLLARTRAAADPTKTGKADLCLEGIEDPDALFAALRMPRPVERRDAEGRTLRFSVQNRIGLWGAWVCHLGILLLILGFALGQMTKEEYSVYGIPGETKQLGQTDYWVSIHDFQVERGADGSVEQYTAAVTMLDVSGEGEALAEDTVASVNHPGSAFGFKLFQNATGDAARYSVRRDGETVQEGVLCVGENAQLLETPLQLGLTAVLWDEAAGERSVQGYADMIYVNNELYTMNVQAPGESIPDFTPYEVSFSDGQSYTLLQVKRDRFTPLALAGGLITLLGLLLAFYLQTRKLWAVQNEDGSWTVCGSSPKGGALFAERVREASGRSDSAPRP